MHGQCPAIHIVHVEHPAFRLWHAGCAKGDVVHPELPATGVMFEYNLNSRELLEVYPLCCKSRDRNMYCLPLAVGRHIVSK